MRWTPPSSSTAAAPPAKLDTADAEALRSFPELTAAAHDALEAGTGFAREWQQDADYVAAVAHARRK